jgi:hypothetical protein
MSRYWIGGRFFWLQSSLADLLVGPTLLKQFLLVPVAAAKLKVDSLNG